MQLSIFQAPSPQANTYNIKIPFTARRLKNGVKDIYEPKKLSNEQLKKGYALICAAQKMRELNMPLQNVCTFYDEYHLLYQYSSDSLKRLLYKEITARKIDIKFYVFSQTQNFLYDIPIKGS